jgi:hypothetical protein
VDLLSHAGASIATVIAIETAFRACILVIFVILVILVILRAGPSR